MPKVVCETSVSPMFSTSLFPSADTCDLRPGLLSIADSDVSFAIVFSTLYLMKWPNLSVMTGEVLTFDKMFPSPANVTVVGYRFELLDLNLGPSRVEAIRNLNLRVAQAELRPV